MQRSFSWLRTMLLLIPAVVLLEALAEGTPPRIIPRITFSARTR
jgi:hypothetical protein